MFMQNYKNIFEANLKIQGCSIRAQDWGQTTQFSLKRLYLKIPIFHFYLILIQQNFQKSGGQLIRPDGQLITFKTFIYHFNLHMLPYHQAESPKKIVK